MDTVNSERHINLNRFLPELTEEENSTVTFNRTQERHMQPGIPWLH
jgi:hypothetical protein